MPDRQDLAQLGAAGNQQVAADRDRLDAGLTGGTKRPAVETAAEIEVDGVVDLQIGRPNDG